MVKNSRKTQISFVIFISVLAVAFVVVIGIIAAQTNDIISRGPTEPQNISTNADEEAPELTTETVVEGLNHPWALGFLPDNTMLINERSGQISAWAGDEIREVRNIQDVYARGEGGLLGLEVDRNFAQNNYIYTCYASTKEDVRVVRWQLNEAQLTLSGKTPIVTGMPLNPSGRHSGCRIEMDKNGILWIGTGDAAIGTNPQDPESLGGKILRVDRNGEPAEGNLGEPFDPRVFSYGHRNTQGLALDDTAKENERAGLSVEHGPDVDDEVNPLVQGNFGWNPVPFYNEDVPMTDLEQYPEAIEAFWRSGSPTIAPSGATFVRGEKWQSYDGMLAIAVLKDEHLRLQEYNDDGALLTDKVLFEGDFGRLRSVTLGPENTLYISTDNGNGEDIIFTVKPE